jgi:hypothetical protein
MNSKKEDKKAWITPDLKEISTKKFEGGNISTGITENPTTYHT